MAEGLFAVDMGTKSARERDAERREEKAMRNRQVMPNRAWLGHWSWLGRSGAVAALVLLLAAPSWAQDYKSYTRETFDQWALKYKDAKPDFKPGDVLTAKDLERMRPFVPPGYLEQLNFPEFKAEIIAPVSHRPRQDYVDCTEKYQGQVKLKADGSVENYTCGQPFPNSDLKVEDPTSGVK